jgi:hypothetical protein
VETITAEPAFVDAESAPAASTLLDPAAVDDVPISTISPELALVDPELAAEARRSLPVPPFRSSSASEAGRRPAVADRPPVELLEPLPTRHEMDPAAATPSAARRETTPALQGTEKHARTLRRAPLGIAAVTGVMALAALFGPLVVTTVSRTVAGGSAGATAPAPASAPAARGYDIRWRPVPGATYYNLVLQVQGVRSLDLWPRQAHVHIPAGSLPPGRYTWFVYPAVKAGARPSYGPLAGRGGLTVPVTNPPLVAG